MKMVAACSCMPIGVAALVLVILQACIGTGGLDSATPTCRHRRGRAGALRFARDALRLRGAGVAGIESSEDDLQLFLAHRRSVCHAHPQSGLDCTRAPPHGTRRA